MLPLLQTRVSLSAALPQVLPEEEEEEVPLGLHLLCKLPLAAGPIHVAADFPGFPFMLLAVPFINISLLLLRSADVFFILGDDYSRLIDLNNVGSTSSQMIFMTWRTHRGLAFTRSRLTSV